MASETNNNAQELLQEYLEKADHFWPDAIDLLFDAAVFCKDESQKMPLVQAHNILADMINKKSTHKIYNHLK